VNVAAVLERIGHNGDRRPTADTLARLQMSFLMSVPFENLDIHLGVPIRLDPESLIDKIVTRRRGGFCYELNSLFRDLLRELGYQVDSVAARMARTEGGFGIPFDHMALIVELEERLLVDVGNGQACHQPLQIDDPSQVATTEGIDYRVVPFEDGYLVETRRSDAVFGPRYRFTLEPHPTEDFAGGCEYHQTSPDSVFTKGRLATLALANGRIRLAGNELAETVGGVRDVRELESEEAVFDCLRDRFGIVFDRDGMR
jgi:N-hydroxyarylamine O-acetyltransferase